MPDQPPFWAREFERLRPELIAYLRRRGLQWLAEDVVAKVALELTARQSAMSAELQSQDVAGLIWQMVKFRARDELRSRFVQRLREGVDVSSLAQGSPSDDPETQSADARRFLRALAQRIDALSEAERQLVMRDVTPGSAEALSVKERVRLHRLRQALATDTLEDLKKKAT